VSELDVTAHVCGLGRSGDGQQVEAFAPGRVNLIGEHTDYTGGLALPMAVDLGTTVRAVRGGTEVVVTSDAAGGEVRVDALAPGDPTLVQPAWGAYVAAVVAGLAARGQSGGLIAAVSSTVPVGAGLSSSASLELAVALAVGFVGTTGDLARLGQVAETAASGVPCGLMDQMASACGVAGHALRMDFTTGEVTPVAVPDDVEVVVVHSGESRTLAGSAYATRRHQCELAAREVGPLRHATVADVAGITDDVVRRRARHVVTENARVDAMVAALAAGDVVTAGALMVDSHRSLADDFGVSTPGLDAAVAALLATDGVFGARLTGAGFGGCAVALARPGAVRAADHTWVVSPGNGATVTSW
jgi:galactokinase